MRIFLLRFAQQEKIRNRAIRSYSSFRRLRCAPPPHCGVTATIPAAKCSQKKAREKRAPITATKTIGSCLPALNSNLKIKKMEQKEINQKIEINAPAEKVWQALWNKDSYKKWAAAYKPGSHYTGDLKTGEKIKFLDPKNNGMESEVASLTENKQVTFRHKFEINEGEQGKSLNDWQEEYTLTDNGGATTLHMTSQMAAEYFDDMAAATQKALQKVKGLAEK